MTRMPSAQGTLFPHEFAADSPLEGDGFELVVPRRHKPFAASAANQQQITRIGCSLRRPGQRATELVLANARIAPVSPVLSGRDQAFTHFLTEESLTRSQPPTPATVKRDCGNCGIIIEKCLD